MSCILVVRLLLWWASVSISSTLGVVTLNVRMQLIYIYLPFLSYLCGSFSLRMPTFRLSTPVSMTAIYHSWNVSALRLLQYPPAFLLSFCAMDLNQHLAPLKLRPHAALWILLLLLLLVFRGLCWSCTKSIRISTIQVCWKPLKCPVTIFGCIRAWLRMSVQIFRWITRKKSKY